MTNSGATTINGNVGISPGIGAVPHFTGFGTVTFTGGGSVHDADVSAGNAQASRGTAFTALDQTCNFTYAGTKELAGLTLAPGVHCATSFHLSGGTLTLAGSASDVWIFKSASDLIISGGAPAKVVSPSCNVWWRVVSTATFDAGSSLLGNILASTSITLANGATLSGRALAGTAEVTLVGNTISACAPNAPAAPPPAVPTVTKAFNATSILVGGNSRLTVTLNNSNSAAITLVAAFVDTLPSGVVVAPAPNASTTCTGSATAAAGGGSVTLASGATIPAGSCTVGVDVTGASSGSFVNTIPAGALQTTVGDNPAPATATLTINPLVPPPAVPTIAKAFNPLSISAGGVSQLVITLNNSNAASLTLTAAFVDTLPGGVVVAPAPGASTTCGGSVTAAAGAGTVTLSSGGTIPSGSCVVRVNVTGATAGTLINTISAGALQTNAGNNPAPASATLVIVPPGAPLLQTVTKTLSPSTVAEGVLSRLTITLSNPNAAPLTLTAVFADPMPDGMVLAPAATRNTTTTCGGAVGDGAGGSVTLPAGSTIPAGSCTIAVNVVGTSPGTFTNTIPVGAIQTNAGVNVAPASAALTVTPPTPVPTMPQVFVVFLALGLAGVGYLQLRPRSRKGRF